MTKINLKKAKEILKEQGYDLILDYDEAVEERYNLIEDLLFRLYSRSEIQDSSNMRDFENYFNSKYEIILRKFIKLFDDNDAIADIYWDIIDYIIEELEKENVDFKFNPLNNDLNLEEIMKRKNNKEFYVLHYDLKTTEYLNEIEFVNLNTAIMQYKGTTPKKGERIEIMYAPVNNCENNAVIAWKVKED